jgi:hypothetical protein
MEFSKQHLLSRRGFCLCCVGGAAFAATNGWLTPRQAFAEARGIVSLIKDSAAVSPIVTYKLRNNISVLEGSGGNIAVLTGPDGKVLIDAGIGVSRPQITKALDALGAEPVTHLVNTHWHFDHADGNAWLHSAGAKIIAQANTRKYLSEVQRVEDWDYNFLPLASGGIPSEVFASEHNLKLNGASIALKYYGPAHRHLRQIYRGQHRSRRRHLLERYLSVHRLFDRRQHRRHDRGVRRQSRGDDGRHHHHSGSRPAGQQQGRVEGIPRHAGRDQGQRREPEKAGQVARRDGRGQADRGLRCEMGPVRHRSRFLHEDRLPGCLTSRQAHSLRVR